MRGEKMAREWKGEEVVQYNRLISEQGAPAERAMESGKDWGGSEKGREREERD